MAFLEIESRPISGRKALARLHGTPLIRRSTQSGPNLSFLEPVSRLAHRDEVPRLRGVRLQLVPQPGDVLIDRA
jgi:hypothetical protein